MHHLRLLLRGLWWRRGLTFAVLAVAVVTTTAAALGPLYARAAGESILQDHLKQGGAGSALWLHTNLDVGADEYGKAREEIVPPGSIKGYDRVVAGFQTPQGVTVYTPRAPLNEVQTAVVWLDGQCAHLVIVHGRCPTKPNEALASQRTIDLGYYHWKLGGKLALGDLGIVSLYGSQPVAPPVRIVGTYRPRSVTDPFWFNQSFFQSHGAAQGPDTVPSLFVSRSEFLSRAPNTYVEADFVYPVNASQIRLADVGAVRSAVTELQAQHRTSRMHVETMLPQILDAAAQERHLVDVGTLLVTLQLALLAWLVLFQVVSDAIEARGNEIAMAKLRGYPAGPTMRFGLGEPLVLLALAVPVGLLLAIGIAHLFASAVLVKGIPVLLPWSAVGTSFIAFAGGAVAAALAGHRTLTRSVLDQWRRTDRRPGHGRLALVVDLILAAAAVVGVFALRQTHHAAGSHDTAALLAPALLVFAVAIIGVRLLPLVCRGLARRTRATRRTGTFLAACQVSRRPVGLRLAALLAVAVGLATFGVAGETVASANRTARAAAEVGANRTVAVQFDPRLDPVQATRDADPNGRWAMTTATWLPNGGNSVAGTVIGVDSARLAAVAKPVAGGPPMSQLADIVGASPVPPIAITASAMRVHLTAEHLSGNVAPILQLNFRTPGNPYLDEEGPAIRPGTHSYVLPIHCAKHCTLRGLTWDRSIYAETTLKGTITLTGLEVRQGSNWHKLDVGLGTPRSWRARTPQGQATDQVTVTSAGIQDRFTNRNGGYGGLAYGADPVPMPAVATRKAMATDPSAPKIPTVIDATNTAATFHIVRYAAVLPDVLDNGVLLDVRFLNDELPDFAAEAQWSVWVGANAPSDWRHRLAAAGLQIQSGQSQAARVDQLARQAPALALLLLLACAAAGAVLAVGGTAISVSASSRRRSYELAALQAVGVTRGALLRASVIEQLLLLGTAVVIGVPTGLLAARLTMPIIPEFADTTPIVLRSTPVYGPTMLFAGAFVLLLVGTALVAARMLIRIAVPSRLREAE